MQGSYQSPLPSFDVEGISQVKPNANLHAIGADESNAALLTDGTSVVNVDLGDVIIGQSASYRFRLTNTSESTNVGRLEIQNSCFADGPCNIPHHKDGFFEYTVNTGTVPDVLPVGEAVDYENCF